VEVINAQKQSEECCDAKALIHLLWVAVVFAKQVLLIPLVGGSNPPRPAKLSATQSDATPPLHSSTRSDWRASYAYNVRRAGTRAGVIFCEKL
jgi:hypothetical protein